MRNIIPDNAAAIEREIRAEFESIFYPSAFLQIFIVACNSAKILSASWDDTLRTFVTLFFRIRTSCCCECSPACVG